MKKYIHFFILFFCFNLLLNAQNVKLELTLTTESEGVCTEVFEVLLHVENFSDVIAENVECRLKLPPYITFVNPGDTVIRISSVYDNDWEEYYIPLRNTGSFTSSSNILILGQITSCDQVDEEYEYGQWDWTGNPINRLGAFVKVPVGHVMSLRDMHITNARVCKGDTAILEASADIDYPQRFVWYSQDLQSIMSTEQIYSGSSKCIIPNCKENTTYYVAVSNDDICPIVLPYAYKDVFLNTSTNQRTTVVQHDDNISFYDEGGQNANYTPGNGTWVHTFKTEETSMYVSFDMLDLGVGDVLNIYGSSSPSPSTLLYSYTYGSTPESFRWDNQVLAFEFVQQGGIGAGWKVTIKAKEESKIVSTILLNAENDRGEFFVSFVDSVLFYDEGGEGGLYHPCDNSYTFTAMLGHVLAEFKGKAIQINPGDSLFVYDGDNIYDSQILRVFTRRVEVDVTDTIWFKSSGQSLTFRLKAVGSQGGWRARITMVDMEASFGKATATIKSPGGMSSLINTTDAETCFRSEGTMKASSMVAVPQYYTWYSPDLQRVLKKDTIYNQGDESAYSTRVLSNETYYVQVMNDTICPIEIPYHYSTVLFNPNIPNNVTPVHEYDYISFYDEGGLSEHYSSREGMAKQIFTTDTGNLSVTFNKYFYICSNDTLYIYDGTSLNEESLLQKLTGYIDLEETPQTYQSRSGSLTFVFAQHNCSATGWNAVIKRIRNNRTVTLDALSNGEVTTLEPTEMIDFYDAGGVNGNYSGRGDLIHTFSTNSGFIKADFSNSLINLNYNDILYIYDGDDVNARVLGTYRGSSNTHPVITSTGPSMTFRLVSNSDYGYSSGWHAEISVRVEGALASVNTKLKVPTDDYANVTTTGAEACFGEDVSLVTRSGIDRTQYLTWYSPTLNKILLRDTLHYAGDESSLPVTVTNDENYYVSVTAAAEGECPIEVPYTVSIVCLDAFANGGTTLVTDRDYIRFYDEGGPDAYIYSWSSPVYVHTFTADTGNVEVTFFDYMSLYESGSSIDSLSIYDGAEVNDQNLLAIYHGLNIYFDIPQKYRSTRGSLTFRFARRGGCCVSGWEALVTKVNDYVEKTILLDEAHNGGVSYVGPADEINFYDAGGEEYEYYIGNNCSYTFTAIQGNIRAEFSDYGVRLAWGDTLFVYNGSDITPENLMCQWTGDNYSFHPTLVSTGSSMTFYLKSYGSGSLGWKAKIKTDVTNALLPVSVQMRVPVSSPQNITTTNDEVCYGKEAMLTAQSDIPGRQYFTWFGPDHDFLFRDTVEQGGISHLTVSINNNATYYASVSTDGECAVAIPQYTIVLLDEGSNNQTTYISDVNNAYFYDGGGDAASYPGREGVLRHTFTAESGQVYALFYGERTIYAPDTLYIYDGLNEDEQHLISAINGTTAWGQIANATSLIQSTTGSLTFVFVQHNNDWGNLGWSALITNKPTKYNTVLLDNVNHGKITPVGPTDIIQFCDDGGDDGTYSPYSRNAQYIHTFKAVQGVIQAKMCLSTEDGPQYMSISESDTLFVYDGDTPNDSCIAKFSGYSILGPTLRSTGPSMTFYLKSNDGYSEGWHAEITASPQTVLAEAKVIIKDPIDQRSHIITSDIENCYGAYDTIKAISDIDAPQYFKWYNGQQNLLSRETIQTAGEETKLPVQIFSNETYYVSVASGGECHVAIPDYNIMLLNDSINNGTTILGGEDYILFYDDGGENGSYSSRQGDLIHSFKADGSDIYVTISNNFQFDSNDTLYIYNGLEVNEQKRLNFLTGQRNISTFLVIHPTENGVTFRFAQHGGRQIGWKIRITTIPLRESSVWMDHENHEGTTFVGPVDVVHFYDDGGPNHQYNTTRHEYYHTFTAVQGNIHVDLEGYVAFHAEGDTVFFHDGADISEPVIGFWATGNNNTSHIESSNRSLTVRFKKEGEWHSSGWAAEITAHPDNLLYPININLKKPLDPNRITTIDGEDCYGEDVTLKAYTDLPDYPQTFFWYDSDLNPIGTSVVYAEGEQAEQMVDDVIETQSYYVTVSNGTECPVIVPTNGTTSERTVLLDAINDGKVTYIYPLETINFYDEGGGTNGFSSSHHYTHTFTTKQGHVQVYFKECVSVCSGGDTLFAFDGDNIDAPILGIWTNYNDCNYRTITSSDSSITFYIRGNCCCPSGWWAQVTAVDPEYSMAKVNAKVKMGVPDSITTHDVTVCYGDEVQLEAFSSISATQTFVWYDSDLTTVLATQPVDNIEEGSHITVTPTVGSKYYVTVTNDENCPILDSGGPMDTSNVVRINVNFYEPVIETDIQADNVEACYNETVTLRAEADNGEVRHFSWYDENYNLLKDTVGDFATLDIVATTNTIYYINGADPSECSILPPNFGEMQSGTTPVSVQVSIKAPADPSVITTNGPIEVCFGTESTLTASSTLNTQQHFVWLKPDRMTIIDEEDVDVNGTSSETFHITETGPYYVAVFENGGCPLEEIVNHNPVSLDKLAAIDVTFAEPSFSQNVTTADVEGCNGYVVSLVASNGGETSHFAWYDENLNFLKDTIGEFGTLDVTVTGDATYYVNASAADECPVLPPHYGESSLLLNSQTNGGITQISTGNAIRFYDDGGIEENYLDGDYDDEWEYTFMAPPEKRVRIVFNSFYTEDCCDYIELHDGPSTEYSNIVTLRGELTGENIYTSTNESLTILWHRDGSVNFDGWDALVGVPDVNDEMHVPELDLVAAHVTLKTPLASSEITTTDGSACRGGEVVLTASANIAFPQTHTWYDEDLNELNTFTVSETDGHSSYTVDAVTSTTNYFVSVGNASECPVSFLHQSEVILNASTNNQTTTVSNSSYVRFYDAGGSAQGYQAQGNGSYQHTFTAKSGNELYIVFSDFVNQCGSTLKIYDGTVADDNHLLATFGDTDYSFNSPEVYHSNSGSITVVQNFLYGCCCASGWNAAVYTHAPNSTVVSLNSINNGRTTAVGSNDIVSFYDGGGSSNGFYIDGGTQYTHTFTAEQGKIQVAFSEYLYLESAVLSIYEGTTVDESNLIEQYTGNQNFNNKKIITSSGSSLTFKLSSDNYTCCPSGWRAEMTAVPELAVATASIKAPLDPGEITTTDGSACRGGEAVLTASANIAFPQTHTWYDEDLNELNTFTISETDGHSSYTVDPVTSTADYFVSVSNASECPVSFLHRSEVILNASTNNQTTTVSNSSYVRFYDAGGSAQGYQAQDNGSYQHIFTAESGNELYIIFSDFVRQCGSTLKIYDGTVADENHLLATYNNTYQSFSTPEIYHSNSGSITVVQDFLYDCCCADGWNAAISTYVPNVISLNSSNNGETTVVGINDIIPFYDGGGSSGGFNINEGTQYTHTFTAEQGKIQVTFSEYLYLESAVLSIYEGTTVDESNLIEQYTGNQNFNNKKIITSSGSSLTFKLSSDNYICCPKGWRAEVVAIPNLAMATASIKFVEPSNIVTTNAEVCYGDSATLTASAELSYPQYYTWFSPDGFTLWKDTVSSDGDVSKLKILPVTTETYYVTVSCDTNCPYIESIHNNDTVVLIGVNGETADKRFVLQANDSLLFYDAGGPEEDMDCSNFNNSCWYQSLYVTAPEGSHIRVHLNSFDRGPSWPYMYIYSYDINGNQVQVAYIQQNVSDKDYVIESDRVRLSFSNNCYNGSFPGWDGYIYAITPEDTNMLSKSKVTVKTPIVDNLNAEGAEICYGSEATLTARSTMDVPQYFTWYDQDHSTILKKDTINNGEEASSITVLPIDNHPYYVAVTNSQNCPIVETIHNHYREIFMDGTQTECRLSAQDIIGFYDGGGPNGNYNQNNGSSIYCDFWAPEDYRIRLHLDNVQLDENQFAYLEFKIYSDQMNENGELISHYFYVYGTQTDIDTIFNSNHIRVEFRNETNQTYPGWDGYIYAIKPHDENEHVSVPISFKNPIVSQTVNVEDVEACYGETVTLTATNGTGNSRYIWYDENYNLVKDMIGEVGTMDVNVISEATYYVNASDVDECPVFPPHYGELSTILPSATITLKNAHTATDVTTINEYACSGDDVILKAYSNSPDYPQYYLWYDRNLNPVGQDTIFSSMDTATYIAENLTMSDTNYYVTMGNNTGCPVYATRTSTVLLNAASNNDTTIVRNTDIIYFYGNIDEGGTWWTSPGVLTHTFTAETGNVYMTFRGYIGLCDGIIFKVYDGTTVDEEHLLFQNLGYGHYILSDETYHSSQGSLTVVLVSNRYCNNSGWEAVVRTMPTNNISEIKLDATHDGGSTFVSPTEIIVFSDEGGQNGYFTSHSYIHTFTAEQGCIKANFEDNVTHLCDNDTLYVYDGEDETDTLLYYCSGINNYVPTFVSSGSSLTFKLKGSNCCCENGWKGQITTVSQPAMAKASITVNPSYQFVTYDTTEVNENRYTTIDGRYRDIDVSSPGDFEIDSIYHTALGCDSTYTLYLTVIQPPVQDIIIASHSNSWTYDGWYHREEVYTVVYGLDTLTADAGSDGKVFTLQGTGDVLTIIPDATAEVIYYTPTPVPNSFSYTLDNEANYPSLTTDTGTLEITPIATSITITANSAAKFYDGIPLTNDGFSYTPDDILVEGDTLVAEIVGSITEIGDSLNRVVSFHVFRNENFNRRGIASYTLDVTNCYTFNTPESGTLSVVDSIKLNVVTNGKVCPGENDGTADITVTGGKEKTPDRYTYDVIGENTAYTVNGHSDGEINLDLLSADNYTVTITDALGLTATATFTIVERPVITPTTTFDCPDDIDTLIKYSGCNLTIVDIGTPNFVAPTGMDMADVTIYNNAPADNVYEVGETIVKWVAKGMCGDSVTCDQIIKVGFMDCPNAVDYENNSYPSVRIGSGCKCWTTENLVSTKYSDGRDIDEVMDYYSYEYPDLATNVSIFGHLYSWYSAADTARYGSVDSVERAYQLGNHIQGICPEGWYLPSDEEYEELNIYSTSDLRSTQYWITVGGTVNTNATGFNSLPGGMYNCSTGRFESMMGNAYYWSCHPVYDLATGAMIDYICEKIVTNNNSRCNGYSIRCIWGE